MPSKSTRPRQRHHHTSKGLEAGEPPEARAFSWRSIFILSAFAAACASAAWMLDRAESPATEASTAGAGASTTVATPPAVDLGPPPPLAEADRSRLMTPRSLEPQL